MIPINFDFFNRKVAFLTTSAMDQALFNTLVKQKSIPFLTFDAFISYLNGPHKKKLCLQYITVMKALRFCLNENDTKCAI